MPFWRTAELASVPGCSRTVTRGLKLFQALQVEVSVRIRQTSLEGASIRIELPMWRTASEAEMLGEERAELVGSDRVEWGDISD